MYLLVNGIMNLPPHHTSDYNCMFARRDGRHMGSDTEPQDGYQEEELLQQLRQK